MCGQYPTRHDHCYSATFHNKNSFLPSTVKRWNNLPLHIQKNPLIFNLKRFLLLTFSRCTNSLLLSWSCRGQRTGAYKALYIPHLEQWNKTFFLDVAKLHVFIFGLYTLFILEILQCMSKTRFYHINTIKEVYRFSN